MSRPFALGDLVRFKTTNDRYAEGIVIHRIVEKRQPTILLIECADQRRAFRFENEISLINPVDTDSESAGRFESTLSIPVFASSGADD